MNVPCLSFRTLRYQLYPLNWPSILSIILISWDYRVCNPEYDYIVCYIYEGDMSDRLNKGEKSDERSTDIDAYYSCDDCGQGFKSRQELKEHESSQH